MSKPNYEQTVKLDTLKNMAYLIAKAEIEARGVYYCIIDSVKTKVIK